jgi:hypothetical protein
MHVLSPVLGAIALFLGSGPALALDTWTSTVERGLSVLSLRTSDGELRVVCDPDRVFGPTSNGAVIVHFPEDEAPSTIVFLAKSGEQARLAIKNGMAAQAAADAADWGTMVEILREGGEFAVVSSKDSFTVETAPLPALACD